MHSQQQANKATSLNYAHLTFITVVIYAPLIIANLIMDGRMFKMTCVTSILQLYAAGRPSAAGGSAVHSTLPPTPLMVA